VSTFFGYFARFVSAWKTAENQNEQRKKKLEAEAKKAAAKNKPISSTPAPEKVIMILRYPMIKIIEPVITNVLGIYNTNIDFVIMILGDNEESSE
jgi:sortase (surface protein transpeptidase)